MNYLLQQSLVKYSPWNIDSIKIESGFLEISGWAVLPNKIKLSFCYDVNDKHFEFDEVNYPVKREDIEDIFDGFDRESYYVGSFSCKAQMKIDKELSLASGSYCRLYIAEKDDIKNNFNALFDYYFPFDKSTYAYPSEFNIEKVTGSADLDKYKLAGFSIFKKLEAVTKKYNGVGIGSSDKILDWGVGSARVLRYFLDNDYNNIDGADVDIENLNWCRETFKKTNFYLLSLFPPSEIESEKYDLIFGISVFTHLNEVAHNKWLEELYRITKPGGIVLVTVHGDMAIARSKPNEELLRNYFLDGFVFSSESLFKKDLVSVENYYGTSYISEKYINYNWAKKFEVLEVIHAFIGNFQDLVVLRKRFIE